MSNDDKILSCFALAGSIIGLALAITGLVFAILNGVTASSETTTVTAIVMDTHYQKAYTTPIRSGKTFVMVPHPERYTVTVRYEDEDYCIDTDEAIYNKCKAMTSGKDTVETMLTTKTTKTGRVKKYMSFKE